RADSSDSPRRMRCRAVGCLGADGRPQASVLSRPERGSSLRVTFVMIPTLESNVSQHTLQNPSYKKRTEIALDIVQQLEQEGHFPDAHYAFDHGVLSLELSRGIEHAGKHWVSELECSRHIHWQGQWRRVDTVAQALQQTHPESFRAVRVRCRNGETKSFWVSFIGSRALSQLHPGCTGIIWLLTSYWSNLMRHLLPYLQDDQKAADYLRQLRWPDGVTCPRCGSAAVELRERCDNGLQRFNCVPCAVRLGQQFAMFTDGTGSIFEESKLRPLEWLL